ncbi:succinylglutamate desuccinylase [Colwelliaceae bacterium MEBiC 14330]
MKSNNTLSAPLLTDIGDENFIKAYRDFSQNGDFIALTRQFEQGLKQTGASNKLHFNVKNGVVRLLDSGVLLVEPSNSVKPNKSIVISSGIHGNETAPIEIVQQLISDIISQKTAVQHRTLFIIGNPVAMNIAKRFQVENLNRLFCGKYQDIKACFEKYRAEKLEQYVSDFFNNSAVDATNYHYDLHTAIRHSKYEKFAIYPYQHGKPWNKEQLSFMQACGVNTILFGHGPTGTFSYYSSANFSAHAFTIELGKVRPFGKNHMGNFKDMTTSLKALICNNPIKLKPFNNEDFNLFEALGDITKQSENFQLLVDDNASNFTDFPINTLLSVDAEQEYRTTQAGESIVFPNANVGNGQRAALMVVPTKL